MYTCICIIVSRLLLYVKLPLLCLASLMCPRVAYLTSSCVACRICGVWSVLFTGSSQCSVRALVCTMRDSYV